MNFKKKLSAILAFLMVASSFSGIYTYAAEKATDNNKVTAANDTAASGDAAGEDTEETEDIDYLKVKYATPEEKLASMKLSLTGYDYELYIQPKTGEVAIKNVKTGQILFSNPYDLASTKGSDDTKSLLMSQIILEFTNDTKTIKYDSYTEACLRDQIVFKNIKNGLRAEYSIGRIESRKLVPRWISAERFETVINAKIKEGASDFAFSKFEAYYLKKDAGDPSYTSQMVSDLYEQYPITKDMAIYVVDPEIRDRELNEIEALIKTYCPEYTFDELDYDHDLVGYEESATSPPLFRMAIEYTLDENGLQAKLAANGIRFDETAYKLSYVEILPYFGCGSSKNDGYTFIPDGSGTITKYEDVSTQLTLQGKVYGSDYAFYTNDPQHRQTMRLPVFGNVELYHSKVIKKVEVDLPEEEWYVDGYGNTIKTKTETQVVEESQDRGFLAIITEGDSLAEISTEFGGALHDYATVMTTFYPRPTDQYNLADATSVGANAMWTVTSERKYTGNYVIKYVLLSDEDDVAAYKEAQEAAGQSADINYYKASYVGMADAYRDYLVKTGVLTKLNSDSVKSSIPLVIESLGAIETTEKILSFPVTVKLPLTTFDDVKTMSTELSSKGISNLVFKLTGFANGGVDAVAPATVKWEKSVGGANGFEDLMSFANSNGVSVYPEFEFSYVGATKSFDGFSYKKHAAKTMDSRYAQKREYNPAYQKFSSTWYNPISPSVFDYFYDKMSEKLLEYKPTGISVGSLGSDLNSDFDKKDPYNRDDSKGFVTSLLSQIQNDFKNVMVSAGNAYSLKYASYITEVPLDSSLYLTSSESIPFMGMVLHSYINFTGSALNMAGDINYEILKCIENGASPYFILCYQNTEKLKEDSNLQQYYSVNYKIWSQKDLVEKYNILNEALADVQDKTIVNHEFIQAERVLTAEELAEQEADLLRQEQEKADEQSKADETTAEDEVDSETESTPVDETTAPEGEEAPAEETTASDDTQEPAEDDSEASDEQEEEPEEELPLNVVDNGKVVKITYENGKVFILNYNNYAVRVDGKEIAALGFYTTSVEK